MTLQPECRKSSISPLDYDQTTKLLFLFINLENHFNSNASVLSLRLLSDLYVVRQILFLSLFFRRFFAKMSESESEDEDDEDDEDADDYEFVGAAAPPPPPPHLQQQQQQQQPRHTRAALSLPRGYVGQAPAQSQSQPQQLYMSYDRSSSMVGSAAPPPLSAPSAPGSFGFSASNATATSGFSFGVPSSTAFGSFAAPATAPSTGGGGGLFGSTAPSTGGGLFGGTTLSTEGSLFGSAALPGGTTLFGSQPPFKTPAFGIISTPSSAGLFGTTTASTTGNAFGSSNVLGSTSSTSAAPTGFGAATAASSTPSFGGLFGDASTSADGAPRPSGFGVPDVPASGLFGAPSSNKSIFAQPASTTGSAFGAPSSTGSIFSEAPPAGGLFGGAPPPPPPPPFATTGFGFGGFGSATPASKGFGGFGSAAPANGNLFGGFGASTSTSSAPRTDPFGSSAGGLFSVLNDADFLSSDAGGDRERDRSVTNSSSLYLNSAEAREKTAQTIQSQFKPVDLTKEMAETYYYGRQDSDKNFGAGDVNAFWLDYAEWDESLGGSFLSQV